MMNPFKSKSSLRWEDVLGGNELKIIRFIGSAMLTIQESSSADSIYCCACFWNSFGDQSMFRCSDSIQITGSCRALAISREHGLVAIATSEGLYVLSFEAIDGVLEFQRMARIEVHRDTNDIKALRISPESKTLTISLQGNHQYKTNLPDLSSEGHRIKVA